MKAETSRNLALRLVEEELSARRYAPGSRAVVLIAVKAFLRWASQRGSGDLASIRRKDLAAYQAFLSHQVSKRNGEPLSVSGIANYLMSVRLLFSCLYRSGAVPENPAQGLTLPARGKAFTRRPLTRSEITRFLDALATDRPVGLRDRALFELIYSSGLRVSEAAGLKVGDIDFERRLMVVRGKFDRDRMVPISDVAGDFLKAFLGVRIECSDAWVFPGYRKGHITSGFVSDHFQELAHRLGMHATGVTTHSIRHSTATHLLENGASVRHVQELLGHSCIESTVRYTHVMVDGLAQVYRKHHPREHELYEALDASYEKRLARLGKGV
jgi:site-specific recombinase XerD